jgi:sulfate adenylyltransferase subunit 1
MTATQATVTAAILRAFNPAHGAQTAAIHAFDIERYLTDERDKDLLRFSTAGSVDDGKSTLIGRLLYDTQSVYDDQVRAIEGKGTTAPGVLDLALLTDGLRAEREQGITIDVAYRYFSTPRRKFIIADTPGHEQYTRNMATGASTADVSIVLVDARKGVLKQSRRHAHITNLLGVRHLIVAINKMDLVEYREAIFIEIRKQFEDFFKVATEQAGNAATLHFLPVSALEGDNVVQPSNRMPWYTGPTLLNLLETLPAAQDMTGDAFRFAVQRIAQPNLDFRGFAGQIASGTIRPGDIVVALPSLQKSRVARVVTFDGDLAEATAPLSVTLTLEDEIDLSRGDLLVREDAPAATGRHIEASLLWMDGAPLELSKRYLLKHASRTVSATVGRVIRRIDLGASDDPSEPSAKDSIGSTLNESGKLDATSPLTMNELAVVALETTLPMHGDRYSANRQTGSFVLIDAVTNATVAAGMILSIEQGDASTGVTEEERVARWGHRGLAAEITGDAHFVELLERTLFLEGAAVLRVQDADVAAAVAQAGGLALRVLEGKSNTLRLMATSGDRTYSLPDDRVQATHLALQWIRQSAAG